MIRTVVCIGSGNMGFAMMKGISAGTNIFFTDADLDKARAAANSIGAKILISNTQGAEKGDYIFLAVKPQVLPGVLAEIAPVIKKRIAEQFPPILVSMAAGWSIDKIQELIGKKIPVVRMMPNTPSLIGRGMIAMACSKEVAKDKITELETFLSSTGIVDCLEERYLDAVTGLSASGPAFTYLFIEALSDGGVLAGLPRDKALRYAAQTVLGAAAMVQETGKHPGELKDMVTSPGGTTIAGIASLEHNAFRGSVIKAVEAAWKRAVELG